MSKMYPKCPDFPTRKSQQLKKGKCYRFVPMTVDGREIKSKATTKARASKIEREPFKAIVEKVYKGFYLLRTPAGYHTTMLKNALGIDWEAERV